MYGKRWINQWIPLTVTNLVIDHVRWTIVWNQMWIRLFVFPVSTVIIPTHKKTRQIPEWIQQKWKVPIASIWTKTWLDSELTTTMTAKSITLEVFNVNILTRKNSRWREREWPMVFELNISSTGDAEHQCFLTFCYSGSPLFSFFTFLTINFLVWSIRCTFVVVLHNVKHILSQNPQTS